MNIFKKISFLIGVAFLISGCNIYTQPMLPSYSSSNLGRSANSQESIQVTQSAQSVNETITTEGVFTPANKGEVKTQDKTVVQRIPFPENEYKSLATTGSATVKGKIFITTAGGNRVYGKNTRLYLNPVTSYSTQWFNESYLGGAKMSKVDPRLFNYLKFTTSDSNGNFEFLNVPSGSYYLIGVVKCGTACGYDKVKNIRIAKKISVFGSDIKEEVLSKEIQ
jgi:hypothetical protein